MEKMRIFTTRIEDCLYVVVTLAVLIYKNGVTNLNFVLLLAILFLSMIVSNILLPILELADKGTRVHSSYLSLIIVWMIPSAIFKWGAGWVFLSGLLIYLFIEGFFIVVISIMKNADLGQILRVSALHVTEQYKKQRAERKEKSEEIKKEIKSTFEKMKEENSNDK